MVGVSYLELIRSFTCKHTHNITMITMIRMNVIKRVNWPLVRFCRVKGDNMVWSNINSIHSNLTTIELNTEELMEVIKYLTRDDNSV